MVSHQGPAEGKVMNAEWQECSKQEGTVRSFLTTILTLSLLSSVAHAVDKISFAQIQSVLDDRYPGYEV